METQCQKFDEKFGACHWGNKEMLQFAMKDGARVKGWFVFTGCSCYPDCGGHDQLYIMWPDGSSRNITLTEEE